MALGRNIDRIERNIESIESKFAKIFKQPKNRQDGSDFDDFWTESIVSTQSIFSKIFERTKNYRINRIDQLDRSIDRLMVDFQRKLTFKTTHVRPDGRRPPAPKMHPAIPRARLALVWSANVPNLGTCLTPDVPSADLLRNDELINAPWP